MSVGSVIPEHEGEKRGSRLRIFTTDISASELTSGSQARGGGTPSAGSDRLPGASVRPYVGCCDSVRCRGNGSASYRERFGARKMKPFLALFIALWIATPARADPATGIPYIVDGDSVSLPFRLFGIDAPELYQTCQTRAGRCDPCGKRAQVALKTLTGKARTIRCERTGTMISGRVIAVCFAGQVDIGKAMLSQGWAVIYRRHFSQVPELASSYIAAEAEAKAEARGIWAGEFIRPERWRRGDRLPGCE